MLTLSIISFILFFIIYVCAGIVCGKICADIIRFKNKDHSELLWFWAGVFLNFIAVFMTHMVKEKKD
jgi:hypothetical protein